MNNTKKYISQPLAKKIHDKAKEKGFELPESEYMWSEQMQKIVTRKWFLAQDPYNQDKLQDDGFRQAVEETYNLYDIAELGEMLPKHTGGYFLKIQMDNKFYFSTHISEDYEDLHQEEEKIMAEAMGKMFYYLLDNNLL